jgi:hypothetical protein
VLVLELSELEQSYLVQVLSGLVLQQSSGAATVGPGAIEI